MDVRRSVGSMRVKMSEPFFNLITGRTISVPSSILTRSFLCKQKAQHIGTLLAYSAPERMLYCKQTQLAAKVCKHLQNRCTDTIREHHQHSTTCWTQGCAAAGHLHWCEHLAPNFDGVIGLELPQQVQVMLEQLLLTQQCIHHKVKCLTAKQKPTTQNIVVHIQTKELTWAQSYCRETHCITHHHQPCCCHGVQVHGAVKVVSHVCMMHAGAPASSCQLGGAELSVQISYAR